MDKPKKKLLISLIENPYNVLTTINKPDIVEILESSRKAVQSGSISVKNITKSVSQIDETLSRLNGFIEEISTFDKSKDDLESGLSVFNTEVLNQMESTLARHQNEKSDLEVKRNMLDNEISEIIESIPKTIRSIESTLNNISAVQYSIKPE